jgi:hypothetical protein
MAALAAVHHCRGRRVPSPAICPVDEAAAQLRRVDREHMRMAVKERHTTSRTKTAIAAPGTTTIIASHAKIQANMRAAPRAAVTQSAPGNYRVVPHA